MGLSPKQLVVNQCYGYISISVKIKMKILVMPVTDGESAQKAERALRAE